MLKRDKRSFTDEEQRECWQLWHQGLLRASAQPLGAWIKRKYQWLAAPVSTQGGKISRSSRNKSSMTLRGNSTLVPEKR